MILIFRRLLERYGPQHWWPAEEPFEVIVGAILTQSAAWGNVEKAIIALKEANALTPAGLRNLSQERLSRLIYSSGYYNAKAVKLKAFAHYLGERYKGDLDRLFTLDVSTLREELLSIHGIGEETADSIILYAAQKPIFVIDAYTRRIMSRLGLSSPQDKYPTLQSLFIENLDSDVPLFNEYHALLVRHAKEACRKVPVFAACCLRDLCRFYQAYSAGVAAKPETASRASKST